MEKTILGKRGLVFGKFMPLHKGHCFLIETARQHVEHLTVLVCTLPNEPISGALRYHWTKEQFAHCQDVTVLHVTDVNPAYPNEHRFFWDIWLDTFRRNAPDTDIVFTSEDYGNETAKRMNIQHFLVDKARKTFPVSGTAVRKNAFEVWDLIPDIVKPYYIKRVALLGAESVGKSTLTKQLAAHFNTSFVEEYGRTYTEKFGTKLQPLDLAHIAAGQLYCEDEAAQTANKLLICDTELLTTQIWSEIYCGTCPQFIRELNHHRRYDLFLLLEDDVPWVDDTTRLYEHFRPQHTAILKAELEARNANYLIINGNYEQRLAQAIAAVEKIMPLS